MDIMVLNRDGIERSYTKKKHIVISVRDPGCKDGPPKFYPHKHNYSILLLAFHDWDGEMLMTMASTKRPDMDKWTFFSVEMANRIIEFVMKHLKDVDLIVCQCEAGISRSAGIAAALSKVLNGDDMYFFKQYVPNSLVYATLLKQLMWHKHKHKCEVNFIF